MARSRRSRAARRRQLIAGAAVVLAALVVALVLQGDGPLADQVRQAGDRVLDQAGEAADDALDGGAGGSGGSAGSGSTALGGLQATLSRDEAAQALARLTEAPPTLPGTPEYDREDYGERWADVDGNGCNQRDDVLFRDVRPGTVEVAVQGGCERDVLAGTWDGPYTGDVLVFDDLKDGRQAQALSIDHVVPLAEAHWSGAAAWAAEERERFANDLDNLVAVDGPTNTVKGADDPARWRPPEESSWCGYALVWVSVKDEWSLTVDAEERVALEDMLASC